MRKCDVCRLALNDDGVPYVIPLNFGLIDNHITILEDTEKEEALRAIMQQYHPGENVYFNPAAIPRTLVYKLTVEKMTGKRKELKK